MPDEQLTLAMLKKARKMSMEPFAFTLPNHLSICCIAQFTYLSSLNVKKCTNCDKEYPWTLKEGQLPLVKATR